VSRRRLATLLAAACVAAVAAPSALAHGGLRIATIRTGAYTARVDALLVRLSPTRTVVDFTTYLSDRHNGAPVTGADLRVTAKTPDGAIGPLRALPAGNTYEVLVPIRDPRQWRQIRLQARITGPAGAATFRYAPPSLASDWRVEWPVVAGCVIALLLFANGFVRLRRRGRKDLAGWGRAALFVTAIAMVYLALDSPLDAIADDYLLSAHMLEHVVIGDLAIALAMLAVRGPLIFFLLPAAVLSPLARNKPLRSFLHWLTGPWVALAVWTAGMWAWHVPRIYDYAATHQTVHQLEHLSFMLGGILVWNLLIDPARTHRLTVPGRILLAVGVFLLGDPVMATLFGGGANYPHYAAQPDRLLGLSPRVDQRLAGTVMLVEQILTLGTCCAFLLWPYLKSQRIGAEESALS
jgi:cytochrome c oxidase assembly factor CtaG